MFTIDDERADYVESIQISVESAHQQWPAGHELHAAVPGYLARTVGETLLSAHEVFGPEEIRSIIRDGFAAAGHTDQAGIDLVAGVVLTDSTFRTPDRKG